MLSLLRCLLGCSLALLLLGGCRKPRNTGKGYWEGKGTAKEVVIKDSVRQLTRSAKHEFWFNVEKNGAVTGEIEVTYDSQLIVKGLPSVSVGVASFNPEVGGEITDLDPTRKFPLTGTLQDGKLSLEIATPEEDRKPIEFTIRADPGVSAGIPIGKLSIGVPGNGIGKTGIIEIPMTPFSPFSGAGKVEKRPSGPFADSFEKGAENWSVQWSARQMRGKVR